MSPRPPTSAMVGMLLPTVVFGRYGDRPGFVMTTRHGGATGILSQPFFLRTPI